jgi:CRISPR system Cascade subunit CasD
MSFLTIRLSAPLMALQGPRIDGEPQSLPIPTRSLLTGLFGSALGYGRGDHEKLQALQDNIRVAVVVHRNGIEINDYQIADLGKSYMRGPMWSSGTSIVEREGSRTEGLRQQERPYRADADMTAIVDVQTGCLVTAEQILTALDQPVHPLFIGRSSCPPASRLAGRVFEASSLEAATLAVARVRNPTQGGHGFRRKADSIPMIADSR